MDNIVSDNKFYNTFTPFINEKTKTAEKTMKTVVATSPPDENTAHSRRSLLATLTAGGFLLVPVFVLLASREQLARMRIGLDRDYFLAVNNKIPGGFLNGVAKKIRITKYYIINGLSEITKPLQESKDRFFQKIYDNADTSFAARTVKNINNFFKNQKIFAFSKQDKRVKSALDALEQNLEKQLQILNSSASGEVKILFPNAIRCNTLDEVPKIVDLSKTASGSNRADEIRKLFAEVKSLLSAQKPSYSNVLKRITYSCEDIFQTGNDCLIDIFLALKKGKRDVYSSAKPVIKELYDNLIKYRYGEVIKHNKLEITANSRKLHLANISKNLDSLRTIVGDNPKVLTQIEKLQELTKQALDSNNMGLLEKIRMLLKCNDLECNLVKPGVSASLFKHYQPEEYIQTKKLINDLAYELKVAHEGEKKLLPKSLDEIWRGKVFTHALSILAPTAILAGNYLDAEKPEEKSSVKRNFYSFIVGALVMTGTHNIAVCSKLKSVLYGIITAFATGKLYDNINN